MSPNPRWLERRRLHRRVALLLTGLCVLAVAVFGEPTLKAQLFLASGAILLLGVPHGAFDAVVAARAAGAAGGSSLRLRALLFLLGYSALATAMIGLWLLNPSVGLLVFLGLSWVHFGRGDRIGATGANGANGFRGTTDVTGGLLEQLEVFVRGGLPLLLPIAFHRDQVQLLFGWLTALPESAVAQGLDAALPILLTLWGLGAVALMALEWRRAAPAGDWRWAQVELLALALTFYLLPPLLGFAVYFCLWHSARHLIALDALLIDPQSPRKQVLERGLPILAATLLLMALAYWALAGRQFEPRALVQVLFVSLAALTVPHIFVTLQVDRGLCSKE